MTDTTKIDSMKRKIAALMAKANSTTNEHEAEAFLAKVNELLVKHQLEEWDVNDIAASKAADPTDMEVLFEYHGATPSMNDHHTIMALARLYGCRVVTSHGRKINSRGKSVPSTKINVIGPISARETTKLMYPFVMKQCAEAGRRLSTEGYGPASKMQLRVVNALTLRIYAMVRAAEREAELAKRAEQTSVAQSRALIIVNEIDALVERKFPDLRTTKARSITTTSAATQEAAKVSLNRQVTGSGTKAIR